MERVYTSKSVEETKEISKEILKEFGDKKIFLFYAEMGAGKTTLIKELVRELGIVDVANSPTFALVNEYYSEENGSIYHFDFYRLEDEEEALDMGYEDYFFSDSYCFVEWPEKIPSLIPEDYVKVTITSDGETRTIKLKS